MPRKNLVRPILFVFFGFLLTMQLTVVIVGVKLGSDGRADFRSFYTAGHMARSGQRHDLYNYSTEQREQNALVSDSMTLPFIHPAAELFLFAPLSLFSYRAAYLTFVAINLIALTCSAALLGTRLTVLSDLWKPLPSALFICFIPAGFVIILGQTELLILLLLCAASVAMLEGKELVAGLIVGLCAVRFQIAIPIALLFLVWRRWKFWRGFVATAGVLAFASVLIVGLRGTLEYVRTLASISTSAPDQARLGVFPIAMPNVRGMVYGLGLRGTAGLTVVMLISFIIFLWASRREVSLPLAIAVASLIGFHTQVDDLMLLVIPMSFALEESYGWKWLPASFPILACPFYPFLLSRGLLYLLALPTTALLLGIGSTQKSSQLAHYYHMG